MRTYKIVHELKKKNPLAESFQVDQGLGNQSNDQVIRKGTQEKGGHLN